MAIGDYREKAWSKSSQNEKTRLWVCCTESEYEKNMNLHSTEKGLFWINKNSFVSSFFTWLKLFLGVKNLSVCFAGEWYKSKWRMEVFYILGHRNIS